MPASLIDFLAGGLVQAGFWELAVYFLAVTQLTIMSVTLYLHRSMAHRSVDFHPALAHVFRFWTWLTTSMITKEWAAIHRKHHAKCETEEDPHSPQTRGLKKVMAEGAELYRAEAKNAETIEKYSRGTPDDWIERNVYLKHSALGVSLMLIINVVLFGAIGATIWAVQMAWIPFWAAGIINGVGHYWGYRNFEAPDASTNLTPWTLIVGGEELHNNHHTYPTSAKFSVKPYEFDIGWVYIRGLEMLGWAKVRKTAPKLNLGEIKPADARTLEALIANRYEVMANYARGLKSVCEAELAKIQAEGGKHSERFAQFKLARRWLHRDQERIPANVHGQLAHARAASPVIDKLVTMREELRQMWTRTNVSAEQLVADLQAWCRRAEESGIAELQAFSMRLRAAHA